MLESAVVKTGEAGSWQEQRIGWWFRVVGRIEGVVGESWSRALLRLYAFCQVQFQECVNGSYDVLSSFHYIPYSHHYIQHINFRV